MVFPVLDKAIVSLAISRVEVNCDVWLCQKQLVYALVLQILRKEAVNASSSLCKRYFLAKVITLLNKVLVLFIIKATEETSPKISKAFLTVYSSRLVLSPAAKTLLSPCSSLFWLNTFNSILKFANGPFFRRFLSNFFIVMSAGSLEV